jgi:Ras-related protein Rab-18
MIVGNKVDMDSTRVVSLQEGLNYAKKRQALFIECSAKTKLGVQQAIEELVQKVKFYIYIYI